MPDWFEGGGIKIREELHALNISSGKKSLRQNFRSAKRSPRGKNSDLKKQVTNSGGEKLPVTWLVYSQEKMTEYSFISVRYTLIFKEADLFFSCLRFTR